MYNYQKAMRDYRESVTLEDGEVNEELSHYDSIDEVMEDFRLEIAEIDSVITEKIGNLLNVTSNALFVLDKAAQNKRLSSTFSGDTYAISSQIRDYFELAQKLYKTFNCIKDGE